MTRTHMTMGEDVSPREQKRRRADHLMGGMEAYGPSRLLLPIAVARALNKREEQAVGVKNPETSKDEGSSRSNSTARPEKAANKVKIRPGIDKHAVPVFQHDAIERITSWLEHSSADHKRRMTAVGTTLSERGIYRIVKPATDMTVEALKRLGERFPNFVAVIEYLCGQIALARRAKRHLRITPVLLAGPPGLGKTMFCSEVAKCFDTAFHVVRFESAQNGSDLAGSSVFWSNSHPGQVFHALLNGTYANPVFFLDELDKGASRNDYGDVRSALYSLFETSTNREFIDQSMPMLTLNCRHIVWFGAANDLRRIPIPILSRMKLFVVSPPTLEQAKEIARQIYKSLLGEYGLEGKNPPKMTDRILEALGRFPPRSIRMFLEEALGHALMEERETLESEWLYRQMLDMATKADPDEPIVLH